MLLVFLAACALAPQSLDEQERALAAKLAEIRKARPETLGPKFDEWDRGYVDAQWAHLMALFRLAETMKEKALWERVVREFTEFIWEREDYLAALQARIYIARAHQALEQWAPCFAALKAARIVEKPEHRKNPEAVEIATRSLIAELRARLDHARDLEVSLRSASEHLRAFAREAESELFLSLRLETARVLHAARRPAEAEKALEEIRTKHAGTEPGDRALELLAGLTGKHAEPFADRLFEQRHFTEAIRWYGKLARAPRVWHRLGLCYKNLRRFYEAATALEQACAVDGPERVDSALLLDQVLQHLAVALQDASQRERHARHREWMRRTLDYSKVGPRGIFLQADSLLREEKFSEAAAWYAKLKPGDEGYEEAVHSMGYCRYRLKQYDQSAADFRAYLAFTRRTPRSTDLAIDLAARSLLQLEKAEEVLNLTETARPQDAVLAEWRLAHRVDAFSRLGRFREAEAGLASMKDDVARDPAIRALERLAAGYEDALRKGAEKALWGRYARHVVRLSRMTFKPLQGEKLLAAADALSLEGTPEAFGMAFDLYAQYPLAATLRDSEKLDVRFRQARAALGAGRLERARELAAALSSANPASGSYRELEADVAGLQADALPRGPERNRHLDRAVQAYGDLSSALDRAGRLDEHYYRLIEKYAARLFDRDPELARRFFDLMERRGYGKWDEDRWGCRSRMEALKKRVLEVVPRR
jgi:hypothetical protein